MDSGSKVNLEKVPLETDEGIAVSEERKWGLPLKEVYKLGLAFYKDKDGKAVHLSYEDRLKLVAFTQQAAHGTLHADSAPPLGVLDVIGKDRRAAWQALGALSKIQAMVGFVHTLDRLCPLFKPYIEAMQKDQEAKKQEVLKKEEETKANLELQERIILEQQKRESPQLSEDMQVQKIKDALNAQTYEQFLAYAQQQYPGNFDQQAVLIRQLQDQHYQQYIQQLAADRRLATSHLQAFTDTGHTADKPTPPAEPAPRTKNMLNEIQPESSADHKAMQTSERVEFAEPTVIEAKEDESEEEVFPPVEEARMWTRGEMPQFKESAQEAGGKLTVGHGETVTVRVPTHDNARALCWEFATDHYDIGFGLYFEWNKSSSNEVTIHVSDSDDDDDPDDEVYTEEELADLEIGGEDQEEGSALTSARPPVSIVVPIFRRDCHSEVYAGSHTYPGEGVYLLKFDNTYSLWRSKTLYYKVYYTQ